VNRKSIVWGLCAAAAIGLAFQAGVVVGENTPPEKMRGMKVSAPTALDLSEQFDSVDGRRLRMRVITFQPGGAAPLHSHKGRPGIVYVLKGTLTEHVEGKGVFDHQEGDSFIEDKNTVHWAENRTNQTTVVLASDIFKP
jgi:quercetin dioxygenase-like cupin family protein